MPSLPSRRSIRLQGYDYTQPGGYFITILAENRAPIFGKIFNSSVQLSPLGIVIRQEWLKLPKRFPNLELDEFVIMPNHFHGILLLKELDGELGKYESERLEDFGNPVVGSIPTIIRSFKSSVTQKVRLMRNFASDHVVWQRNYYEHVIRTPAALEQIRAYIQGNPALWEQDEHYIGL